MIRLVAVATLTAILLLNSAEASAQSATATPVGPAEQVDGDIKGTIGLGLLGMEVGLLLPPLFKLHDQWWAWTLFPVIGAAGGAVGGILAFEGGGSANANITVPIFAAGVALVIPALVGSLAIKSKREAQEMDSGSGLVRLNPGGTFLRMPALAVNTRTNTADQQRFGVSAQRSASVNVPLLSGRF